MFLYHLILHANSTNLATENNLQCEKVDLSPTYKQETTATDHILIKKKDKISTKSVFRTAKKSINQ